MEIAIIKLGALGDVIRTLSVLPAIKEKFPNSEITWITKEQSLEIVKNNSKINKVLTTDKKITGQFDILYNFDIDNEATELAKSIGAYKKYGFYLDEGFPTAFNLGAEYYLNTIFDDELKKSNKKTYQEMMFEAAELEYRKQHEMIVIPEKDRIYANSFAEENKINRERLIGIHIGASPRWPSKKWHEEKLEKFIKLVLEKDYEIILFGGPNEQKDQERLFERLIKKNPNAKIYKNNPRNTIMQFASLVNSCSAIVCSDSFAMHLSLALKKPTIALFFVTSPHEVEGYGLLKKVVSPMLKEFFPEKSNQYSEELTKSIKAEEVFKLVKEIENEDK